MRKTQCYIHGVVWSAEVWTQFPSDIGSDISSSVIPALENCIHYNMNLYVVHVKYGHFIKSVAD